jgi:hypothetical protein
MDIPFNRWYPAIANRHSRRRYDSSRPIPPDILAGLQKVSTRNSALGGGVSKRLDCGIAMLHLEIAALHHGIRGVWELMEAPQVARFNY